MIYNLYKQRGETPLECIQRFAKDNSDLKGEKMTYLGRLDPLAEGVLLAASGEDIGKREKLLELNKEYDFVSLFGFATDTYDVLGKVLRVEKLIDLSEGEIRKIAMIYEGEREQKYPPFSSKIIAKRNWSLEQPGYFSAEKSPHSRASRAPRVALETSSSWPSKKIVIYRLQFHGLDTLNNKELFGRLLMDISKVKGDFRQHEILTLWKQVLLDSDPPPSKGEGHAKRGVRSESYFLGKFSADVSSGTYIRSLVNDIGSTLGCGATVLSIKRIRVGGYRIEDSIK